MPSNSSIFKNFSTWSLSNYEKHSISNIASPFLSSLLLISAVPLCKKLIKFQVIMQSKSTIYFYFIAKSFINPFIYQLFIFSRNQKHKWSCNTTMLAVCVASSSCRPNKLPGNSVFSNLKFVIQGFYDWTTLLWIQRSGL